VERHLKREREMAVIRDDSNTAHTLEDLHESEDAKSIDMVEVIKLPTANDSNIYDTQEEPGPNKFEVGDLIVSYLEQIGVEFVFGIPGGAIEPMYNAIARGEKTGKIRSVIARHETGAAFMADGYTSVTGKLGVCVSTTGPGATNLITGVASAYENNVPMLIITAQTSLSSFGKGGCQESSCTGVNTVGMFQHCTRYNTLISHVDQLERKLTAAILSAYQSPQGPVHLSIPLDILSHELESSEPSYDLNNLLWAPSVTDENSINLFCEELAASKNSVFIVGDQCSNAIGRVLEAAVILGSKIVTPPNGKGLVSPYHPLFRGVVGFAGHEDALKLLNDPTIDTIVAVGASLGEWECVGLDITKLNKKIIHVSSTEGNLTHTPMAKLHVRGTIDAVFKKLLEHLDKLDITPSMKVSDSRIQLQQNLGTKRHFEFDNEESALSDSSPIKPQRLMAELPKLFPGHTRYTADAGNNLAWAIHYLHPYDRRISGKRDAQGGLFRVSLEFASMAWGIGSSIGMSLALKSSPVVCITGDGSYLMSGQEITTAIQHKLNVIFVILNDSSLGMVKHGQEIGGAESIGHELPAIDFTLQAKSLNIPGFVINSVDDLQNLDIQHLCNRGGPSILDVRIDVNEIPPMVMRVSMLH